MAVQVDSQQTHSSNTNTNSKDKAKETKTSLENNKMKGRNLYQILGVNENSSASDIRQAYYKLALKYHPDRAPISATESESDDFTQKFKDIGFAYEILSDPEKRKLFDKNPLAFADGNSDLSRYTELFSKISVQDIEDFKKHYIGSAEELEDILASYVRNFGDISKISEEVFFGSVYEEDRYREILKKLIARGVIPDYLSKGKTPESERKKAQRVKKADKEAKEASAYAKKLGLFDDNNNSNLSALIQGRQKSRFDDMINNLESKYGDNSVIGSPSLKRIRSDTEFDIQPISTKNSKRVKSNFPAKK